MNNVFVYITLFFLKIKQNANIKPKHLKLIQMHLQMCNQNICMHSWTMAFAFESSETFAFKCVDMHLSTSLNRGITYVAGFSGERRNEGPDTETGGQLLSPPVIQWH